MILVLKLNQAEWNKDVHPTQNVQIFGYWSIVLADAKLSAHMANLLALHFMNRNDQSQLSILCIHNRVIIIAKIYDILPTSCVGAYPSDDMPTYPGPFNYAPSTHYLV